MASSSLVVTSGAGLRYVCKAKQYDIMESWHPRHDDDNNDNNNN